MRFSTILPTLSFFLLSLALEAQDRSLIGWLPGVQFSGKLTERLEYFAQLGSETIVFEQLAGTSRRAPEMLTLDLTGGLHAELGPNWDLAASLLVRSRKPFSGEAGAEIRPWQQLTYIVRFGKYRLRNRLRAEQRFIQAEKGEEFGFDLRLRYRLSLDFPLEGERLDQRECYLNTSAEWLLTPTRERAVFYSNPRAYLGLGYRFSERTRLETGPEFRTRNVDEAGNDQHIWYWRTTWIMSW